MELTRDPFECLLDACSRVIGGSGVANDPIVNEFSDRRQASVDHRRLVLDNHAKTNRLFGIGHCSEGVVIVCVRHGSGLGG